MYGKTKGTLPNDGAADDDDRRQSAHLFWKKTTEKEIPCDWLISFESKNFSSNMFKK